MVGKTFKGMTDELLAWQTAAFPRLAREETGPTVLLCPELVVEIEIDGAQHSTRYPGGVTLRFARVGAVPAGQNPGLSRLDRCDLDAAARVT